MNTITDLIKAFMILVNAGGIFRIITLILVRLMTLIQKKLTFEEVETLPI